MTHYYLLSGVGDGAALQEAQLLMYPSVPYAAHCESARCGHIC
nr:hypothetical protein Hi04_10k_c5342_00020 [uncultured bacterium]